MVLVFNISDCYNNNPIKTIVLYWKNIFKKETSKPYSNSINKSKYK